MIYLLISRLCMINMNYMSYLMHKTIPNYSHALNRKAWLHIMDYKKAVFLMELYSCISIFRFRSLSEKGTRD